MDKKYEKELSNLINDIFTNSRNVSDVIAKYYDNNKSDIGNKKSEFYKKMRTLINDALSEYTSLRDKLDDPDSIQRYDTR